MGIIQLRCACYNAVGLYHHYTPILHTHYVVEDVIFPISLGFIGYPLCYLGCGQLLSAISQQQINQHKLSGFTECFCVLKISVHYACMSHNEYTVMYPLSEALHVLG